MQDFPDSGQSESQPQLSSGFWFPCLLRGLPGLSKVLLRELEQQGSELFAVASSLLAVHLCSAHCLFSSRCPHSLDAPHSAVQQWGWK